jgi:hypothetical protein
MQTKRSFVLPLLLGSALLAAATVLVLCYVPLVECGCCSDWDPVNRHRTPPVCGWCDGKLKVSCWKHYKWVTRERLPLPGAD